jgi:poly(3-hydroxybutyrate) depolymerase
MFYEVEVATPLGSPPRGGLNKMMNKVFKITALTFYIVLFFVGTSISIGFLAYSVTWWGKCAAIWGLVLTLFPLILYLRFARFRNKLLWHWLNRAWGILVVGGIIAGLLATPSGASRPGSSVSQHFVDSVSFPRYAFSNMVPEVEQVNLGFLIMPYLDSRFTRERAHRVSTFTLKLYREMDSCADFRQLGSAMGMAYADVMGHPYDAGHYFLYIPQHRAQGALPAIIFLHGSVGNFKVYTWAWSKLAEELGYAIIAPSFGFGEWDRPEGVRAVESVVKNAETKVNLDKDRMYLAGLSNGGLGVSLSAKATPELYRGLIFISPVMTTEVISSKAFQAAWAGRPMIVVAGEADERVPIGYVDEQVKHLQEGGISVSYLKYPGEDHFLFFSKLHSVLKDISGWLSAREKE